MKYIDGLVSIVMPTYKRSEKLIRAVESVLKQTYTQIELLLINDNDPNDEYTEELKKRVSVFANDSRFKLIMQDYHINGAVARNKGIKLSQGEYIAFLDDDDWWEPQKIEKQIEEIKRLDSSWGGVSCKYKLYNMQGKEIGKSLKYRDGYIYKDILYLLSDVATGTLLLRHAALDEAGYFDENLKRHQDLQLLVFFTYKYKLHEVDSFLHCVDVSDTNNRPNPKQLIQYKKDFFKSISPIWDTLTKSEQRCVMAMHHYELGFVYLKNHDICNGLKNCLYVFSSGKAFITGIKKTLLRLRTR